MRLIITLAVGLTLAACNAPVASAVNAPEPSARVDLCGAAERLDWVGRARADLPAPPTGANWRIYSLGDALTEDLRVERLNIEIDAATQKVARLWCG